MKTQATEIYVAEQNNFPLAVASWSKKIWQVYPVCLIGLFLNWLVFFAQKKQVKKTDFLPEFVFVIQPLFLLLMLPIQLFLPLRDWLPTRYLLIPACLMFPGIGMGLHLLLKKFSVPKFWQWYLLGVVFFIFELYSLQLNTHGLISRYSKVQFNELQQTLTYQIKSMVASRPGLKIYVCNPEYFNEFIPKIDLGFVSYFLIPEYPSIFYVSENDLRAMLVADTNPKIVISTTAQTLPADLPLSALFRGTYYNFFITP